MRRSLILTTLVLLALAVPQAAFCQTDTGSADSTGAADSSDLFLNAYMANEQGEKLETSGEPDRALEKFRYAASLLDQITRDDPTWQPIVVDYRKKRVSENILKIQQQVGTPQQATPGTDSASSPLEGDLPQKDTAMPPPPPAPPPGLSDAAEPALPATALPAGTSQQVQDQIAQLKSDLLDTREKLRNIESQKQDLASRLDDALKQLDQTKVNDAELKGQLKQAQDAYQNSLTDHTGNAGSQKLLQDRISQLENTLRDAEADRDAADEQNADEMRRVSRVRQQLDAANTQAKEMEGKFAGSSALAGKLDAANKQIKNDQTEITSIKAQRDQALTELDKAKAAEAKVTELMADNTSLSQKLADDEKTIREFKSTDPEKDKEIAALRRQVGDTKALLATAQQERDNVQSSLNDLQQQYDSATAQLTELKANGSLASSEKKTLTDENDLLRGIVLRALRGEAARDQAKRLVMQQLAQLRIQSDDLLKRIDYLGEPVIQLTEKEKSLFKDPSIDLAEPGDSSMVFNLDAPKQNAPAPVVDTVTSVAPANPANAVSTLQSENNPVPVPPTADGIPAPPVPTPPPAEPSATPTDLATMGSTPALPETSFSPPPSAPEGESSSSAQSTGNPSGPASGASMVPPGMMDDARQAKDSFERGEYRDAERVYEKMLTQAPNNVYILSNLGVAYFRDGKNKLAEESLQKAITVAPEDTFSWTTLGIVYFQEKRWDDAINALTRALAINKNYAVAHNYLGIAASEKGWQEAARKELETATDLDPNYGDAYFNLAVVYATQQPVDKELARKYYKRATDLGAEPDAGMEQLLK